MRPLQCEYKFFIRGRNYFYQCTILSYLICNMAVNTDIIYDSHKSKTDANRNWKKLLQIVHHRNLNHLFQLVRRHLFFLKKVLRPPSFITWSCSHDSHILSLETIARIKIDTILLFSNSKRVLSIETCVFIFYLPE